MSGPALFRIPEAMQRQASAEVMRRVKERIPDWHERGLRIMSVGPSPAMDADEVVVSCILYTSVTLDREALRAKDPGRYVDDLVDAICTGAERLPGGPDWGSDDD